MLEKNPEQYEHLQRKDKESVSRNLTTFIERVREDIEGKNISEAEGIELITLASIMMSMLTTT